MTWSNEQLKLFLAFVCRSENLFNVVSSRISVRNLYDKTMFESAIILDACKRFKQEFGYLPTGFDIFKPILVDTLKAYPTVEAQAQLSGAVLGWAKDVMTINSEQLESNQSAGKKLALNFINDFSFKTKLKELSDKKIDPLRLREELNDIVFELTEVFSDQEPEEFYPLLEPENYLYSIKITPTGIGPWDAIFRGLRHSEVYLILGFTGHGKSTLAYQVATNAAKNEKVYFATYEDRAWQEADPDDPDSGKRHSVYTVKALASITGLSRDVIDLVSPDKVIGFNDLAKEMQDEILTVKNLPWARNLRVVDYSAASLESSTFSSLIQRVRKTHEKERIRLLVIDPFWPMLMRTAAAMNMHDVSEVRALGQRVADDLHKFGQELGITTILVHQLGASASDANSKKLTMYASAEIRTIAWRFENVLIISKMRNGGICDFIKAKARNSGEMNLVRTVKFEGALSQFRNLGEEEVGSITPGSHLFDTSGKHDFLESAEMIAKELTGNVE